MSAEENKAMVRLSYEKLRQDGVAAIDEFYAPDYVGHAFGGQIDRDGLKQAIAAEQSSLSELQGTVEDVIAEGDRVVLRLVSRAKRTSEVSGVPATNVTWGVIHIHRIQGGKIAETWSEWDRWSIRQQLGTTPPSA